MYSTLTLLIISANAAVHKSASFVGFYAYIMVPTLITTLFTMLFIDHNVFISPTFWGLMGGLCRWLQGRQSIMDGMSSVVVGGIASTALSGAKIPLLDSIIQTTPEISATVNAFFIGFIAIVMLGFILDFVQDFMKRKKERE